MTMRDVDLKTLTQRATGGLDLRKGALFKPSMSYAVLKNPYSLWCDYHVPKEEAVDETSRYEELRMKWGGLYETEWVRKNHPDALEIKPRWGFEALQATLKAMLEGVPAIHAPQLWDLRGETYGVGDVIVRCNDTASNLGSYHYRVMEIKRSKNLQEYHAVQAVFYNRVLDRIQGYRPPKVDVVLKEESIGVPAKDHEGTCDEVLEVWRRIRDGKLKPDLPGYDEAGSPWRVYTNKLLEKARDVTLFPAVRAASRRKLAERLGVTKVDGLAKLAAADFQKAFGPKAGLHVWYKYEAHRTGRPFLVPGEKLKIPRRKRRFYFDFETCEDGHPTVPGHVYLVGSYDAQKERFDAFLARGQEEEAKIFEQFLDQVGNPRDAVLYHWTSFEIGQMRGVMERHPKLKERLSRLIDACVDLKECIAKKVFFGTRTYSIKEVAPFLGFRWRQEDVDAYESMVVYWDWLEDGDSGKIDRAVKYNEDDCLAMVHIDKALEGVDA